MFITRSFYSIALNSMKQIAYSYFFSNTGLLQSLWRFLYFSLRVLLLEWTVQDKFCLTSKRFAIFLIAITVFPLLMIWNHIGFWLDDIIFINWRRYEVRAPLFLVGNARSGTTWLHRLITHNSKRFTTMKTWEIAFATSITWRWLFGALYNLDKAYFRSALYNTIMAVESIMIDEPGGNANSSRETHVHPTGLMEAEEDEWLMVHAGYSQLILFFFPQGGELIHNIIMFDCAPDSGSAGDEHALLDQHIRREIFAFYKHCVQRHVYYHSHYNHTNQLRAAPVRLTFVSKNPAFTLRIPTIYATFPDAKIVSVLRDPVQSVPSMISYISKVWHTFAEPVEKYPDARQLLGFCKQHYLFPLLHLRKGTAVTGGHPTDQWAFVSYHHLLADLENVVLSLLSRLYGPQWAARAASSDNVSGGSQKRPQDDETSIQELQEFRMFLRQEQIKASKYKTRHVHSVAQCCGGMTKTELKEELRMVYEEHTGAFS